MYFRAALLGVLRTARMALYLYIVFAIEVITCFLLQFNHVHQMAPADWFSTYCLRDSHASCSLLHTPPTMSIVCCLDKTMLRCKEKSIAIERWPVNGTDSIQISTPVAVAPKLLNSFR